MTVSADCRAARQSTLVTILADAMTYVTMRDGLEKERDVGGFWCCDNWRTGRRRARD
jgi:hypothetical protein